MDPITLGVGGVLVAAGWLLGRIRRSRPVEMAPDACGCSHPLSFHDRDVGTCTGEIRREHYDRHGSRNGYEWVDCMCRQYTGAIPVGEMLNQAMYRTGPPESLGQ